MNKIFAFFLSLLVSALIFLPTPASASHSWNGYHWARTSNPFVVKLGNNTSGSWTTFLATASADWSKSSVLDTPVVAGGTRPKSCRPTSGRDEVCSANYGNTGWLGLAQIWITGGVHITQGIVKNNDYYFNLSNYPYNNNAEKLHVICQEIGHTLGLDHPDESGASLNTCMDYYHNLSNSDVQSTHPNQHDYDQLGLIYAHLDSFNTTSFTSKTLPSVVGGNFDNPNDWGTLVRDGARESVYEKNLGFGNKLVTFVTWAKSQ